MTGSDREWLRKSHPAAAARVERLLAEPRALLVSVLLGNMSVNTLYFVVTSTLALQLEGGAWVEAAVGLGTLLSLVIAGETLPKLAGNAARRRIVAWVSAPMLLMHRALGPVRHALDGPLLSPLVRLAGHAPDATVQQMELAELLAQSQKRGILAAEESRAIRRVTRLGARLVREVMTPRVDLAWVPAAATHAEVLAEAARHRRRRMVVADGDLDSVAGFLDVRSFLLDARGARAPLRDHVSPAGFVPEVATIDQLLAWFEQRRARIAVVVDEFGGTAGVVTLRDALGEIGGLDEDTEAQAWSREADGAWVGPGDEDLGAAFERLGLPEPSSDVVQVGGACVEVLAVRGARIDRVRWRVQEAKP
jgi:putative hemolysin